MRLLENWRDVLRKAWSARVALFWGAVSGLVGVWSAFQDFMPLWLFAGLSVAMSVALVVARLTAQPGADL